MKLNIQSKKKSPEFKGNIPAGGRLVASIKKWRLYFLPEHAKPPFANYKLILLAPSRKANYWIGFHCTEGRMAVNGHSRALQKFHPELFFKLLALLKTRHKGTIRRKT